MSGIEVNLHFSVLFAVHIFFICCNIKMISVHCLTEIHGDTSKLKLLLGLKLIMNTYATLETNVFEEAMCIKYLSNEFYT